MVSNTGVKHAWTLNLNVLHSYNIKLEKMICLWEIPDKGITRTAGPLIHCALITSNWRKIICWKYPIRVLQELQDHSYISVFVVL